MEETRLRTTRSGSASSGAAPVIASSCMAHAPSCSSSVLSLFGFRMCILLDRSWMSEAALRLASLPNRCHQLIELEAGPLPPPAIMQPGNCTAHSQDKRAVRTPRVEGMFAEEEERSCGTRFSSRRMPIFREVSLKDRLCSAKSSLYEDDFDGYAVAV